MQVELRKLSEALMKYPMFAKIRQFAVYFTVGGFVGVLSVVLREVLGLLLPADTPAWYTLSVAISYGAAILLSFSMHRYITFAGSLKGQKTAAPLSKFGIVAIIGLIATSFLAPAIRYGLDFDRFFGAQSALLAFIVAALLVSVLSYFLNARFTFTSAKLK